MISFKQFLIESSDVTKNPKFRKFFRGSKVKDGEGNPLVVYHGSGKKIDVFDYFYTNQGADAVGSGFYFTTSLEEADRYSRMTNASDEPKLGGSDNPTVHPCYLCIKNPLDADKIGSVGYEKIQRFIWRSPEKEDALTNFGDVEYEGRSVVMNRAIESYIIDKENIVTGLFALANDFFSENVRKFNQLVYGILGYDGIKKVHPNGVVHYVAFFPYQIKHVDNIGTFNSDSENIFESLNPDLAQWSVDPEDVPVGKWAGRVVFHGTEMGAANDIMKRGIDNQKSSKGYYGRGFYCASDYELARNNYADFGREDDEESAVLAIQINPKAKILDMRNEKDWEKW